MEFIKKFKDYLLSPLSEGGVTSKKNAPSKVTVKNYLADINHFVTWIELRQHKSFSPTEITLQLINEFKAEKLQTLSASSVERHISSLRKFFAFLKLNGDITTSPFDQVASNQQPTSDELHLHEFKNYLYTNNSSHLTIKNYLIDVKQFLTWAEEVLGVKDAWHVADKDVLSRIDDSLVEEYKNRLFEQHIFSASSINRKLSSLRKYLSWAGEQGYLAPELRIKNYELRDQEFGTAQGVAKKEGLLSQRGDASEILTGAQGKLAEGAGLSTVDFASGRTPGRKAANAIYSHKPYSKIPPIRLFQKVAKAGTFTFDLLITAPVAHVFKKVEHGRWTLQGKPLFKKLPANHTLSHLHTTVARTRFQTHVSNISKHLYAPLSISTRDFPWYKKLWHHAQHTRPMWYRKYHQLAFAHYFNWAVLIIFATAMGVGMYNSFLAKPSKSLAALPTAPLRVLSFQGRLTDANDNPITSPSWIRFAIYNDSSSTGSAKLWEEADKVSPDSDGIFSIYLGSDGNGGTASTCVSFPATTSCGIPSTLFSQNNALWLGVTVENKSELTPREQLATVAYASNSETLQGLQPITAAGAGTQNVVLALNSSGNLSIGASTTFQSTSGQFTVSGNTLALNTNTGTNGNIVLAPDGLGTIDLQRPLQTSTNNGDIASVPNALTIEDLTAILATSSGQSALTINQNGAGSIISASASGSPKFTVDNSGNTTANAFYTGLGSTYYINNATSNLNSLTLAANLTVSGNVASNLIPDGNGTRSLGDASHQWLNIYGENIYSNGQLLTSYWNENLGALSPVHTRDDLIIGGTATSDAKFQVSGTTGTTYIGGKLGVGTTSPLATTDLRGNSGTTAVASVSGATSFAGLVVDNSGVGDLFTASTSGLTKFVIQKSGNLLDTNYTANGGIFYTDSTGLFKQVNNASANTILHGGTTPTFSAVDLTADVTGTLPINKGGTNTASIGSNGQVAYSNGSAYAFTSGGSVGNCLTYQGASAPTWGSCGSGGSGTTYWTLDSTHGDIYPINTTLDLLVGGTATASSKFAVTGIAGSLTPYASVSATTASGGSGTGVTVGGDGSIQSLINGDLTIGGNTTGEINLKPGNGNGVVHIVGTGLDTTSSNFNLFNGVSTTLNFAQQAATINLGASAGTVNFAASTIDDSRSTVTLFGTPTSITLGGAATTLNLGAATGTTTIENAGTINGNVTLGTNNTKTLSINALLNTDLIPTGNGSINLGSGSHYYNTIYANSINLPVGNGTSGFWTITNNTNLYPSNTADDLLIGGNASNSATFQVFASNYANDQGTVLAGTATTSGSLSFRGAAGSQTQFKFDLLNGSSLVVNRSVGGDKGETAVLTIGNDGNIIDAGNLAVNGSALTTTQTTFNLLTNATTLGIGGSSGTTTINNNLSITGTLSLTGNLISNIIPNATTINLGSSAKNFGTVFTQNLQLPITGGLDGYWNLQSGANYGVLSPSNLQNDLAIGGAATSSAKFQIFANTGNATTSGNLTFAGTAASNLIAARNNAGLTIGDSQTGNIILNGGNVGIGTTTPTATLDVAGAASISSTLSFRAGGGTIQTTKNELLNLGGNTTGGIVFGSNVTSNIVPSLADSYNLGSASNEWNNLYVKQIISPSSGGIAGYWQLNTGVLAPVNLSNDLAIGGAATSSAKFQVFGNTGNATTSGNLTFNSASPVIQTTNMYPLTIGSSTTGPIQLSPKGTNGLYVDGTGNVGVGTIAPGVSLDVSGAVRSNNAFLLTGLTGTGFNGNASNNDWGIYNDSGNNNDLTIAEKGGAGSGISTARLVINHAGGVGIGTTSPLGFLTVNGSSIGKALGIFNQTGDQDIFTASTSGTTKFILTNSGTLGIGSGITDSSFLPSTGLDIQKNSLGNALVHLQQLSTDANADLIVASDSASAIQFRVTNAGNVYGRKFTDLDNTIYYLDPAGLTVSASVAGSMTFTPASEHDINYLNGSAVNFQRSAGGDAGLTSTLYVGGIGNVGIGTTAPNQLLHLYSTGTNDVAQQFESNNSSAAYSVPTNLPSTAVDNNTDTSCNNNVAWTNPGNVTANDSVFTTSTLTTGQITHCLKATNFGFSLNASATIVGIQVGINRKTAAALSGGVNKDTYLKLLKAGNQVGTNKADTSTSWPSAASNPSTATYGSSSDTWGITPALTGSDVNNSNFGLEFTANATTNNATAEIDYITLTVYYKDPSISQGIQEATGLFKISNSNALGTNDVLTLDPGTGYLGIGTNSPLTALDIAGSASTSGNLSFRGTSTNNINLLNGSNLSFQTSVGGDTGLSTALYIANSGNVGIGNTSPGSKFVISDSADGTHFGNYIFDAPVTSGYTTSFKMDDTGLTINEGSSARDLNIQWGGSTRMSVSHSNGNLQLWVGSGTGSHFLCKFSAGSSVLSAIDECSGASQNDFTENVIGPTTEAGDVVEVDPKTPDQSNIELPNRRFYVSKSATAYSENAMGIISQWGMQLDLPNGQAPGPSDRILSISGVVPVKVSTMNGPIHKGDPITSSLVPGVGMKATRAGPIVGKATEDFNDASATQAARLVNGTWQVTNGPCKIGESSCYNQGKILSLLDVSWYDPDVYLSDTGNVQLKDEQPSADFTIPHYYTLTDALGQPITRVGEFAQAVIGNLRAGSISTQQLFTNSLAIATSNVSIAGQSLHDYIATIAQQVVSQTQGQAPISPVSQIATNVISPLGDNPQIQIRVKNSGIEIAKDASSSAVASIDNNGNATFSGTLNSQNLAVNGDATVSGTLHADKIEANSIAGLQEVVSTLSAQNITNVTNIFFATPSGTPLAANNITGSPNPSSPSSSLLATNYQLPSTGYTDIASYSAYFAYVPNLNATTGMFQQGLVSLGPTSLMDTSITGTLSVGSQMVLADTSLNVLGSDFAIQPLRQGGVTFEGGLIAIDTNGNLTVNGNAVFNKNLAVNTISPLAGHDVNVILNDSEGSLQDSSALPQNDTKFNIKNASNSAVFAVNQLGDVVASGAATVGKLNFDLVQPALAVSNTEVVATGSAGTAAIKAFQKEVTIDNPNVTANSLIYITPVGTNQTPYLERQVSGKSFTVGVPTALPQSINFNWLIVN